MRAESETWEVNGPSLEAMDPSRRRLPLPPDEGRRVFRETTPRSTRPGRAEHWLLRDRELDVRRTIAYYYPGKRLLVRKVGPSQTYGNRPGIAWNLELLQRADHWNRRPLKLVCKMTEPRKDGSPRAPYVVTWEVVRAFAWAALEGDTRWLIQNDVDDQLLLPMPCWGGVWTAPPALKDDPDEPGPEQIALLEYPKDPPPVSAYRFPV